MMSEFKRQYRRGTGYVLLGVCIGTVPWWAESGWKVIFPALGALVLMEAGLWIWDRWSA